MTAPIMAATAWPTNAHLIADCARLGYLGLFDHTLDPTYGKGTWWKLWRPEKLTTHDLTVDGVDFRDLPHPDGSFDAAVFDPPYVAPGGRTRSTIPEFNARYGLHSTGRRPEDQQVIIDAGLTEVARVVTPGGRILVKCQDYVNGGKLYIGTHHTLTYALSIGLRLQDRLEHWCKNPRPQPPRTRADGEAVRQHHARRNLSTLFVLEKPR